VSRTAVVLIPRSRDDRARRRDEHAGVGRSDVRVMGRSTDYITPLCGFVDALEFFAQRMAIVRDKRLVYTAYPVATMTFSFPRYSQSADRPPSKCTQSRRSPSFTSAWSTGVTGLSCAARRCLRTHGPHRR